jgi:hypothetical protein
MFKKLSTLCLLALLPACGIFQYTPGERRQAEGSEYGPLHGRYTGPECADVFFPEREPGRTYSYESSDDIAPHVMLIACDWAKFRSHKLMPRLARQDHLEFDDRRLSHAHAAQLVWTCSVTPNCAPKTLSRGQVLNMMMEQSGSDIVLDLGLAAVYANILDPSKIRDELTARKIPSEAIDEFVAVVEGAKAHVLAASRGLKDYYEIAVDLPLEIFRERQAYFAEHKDRFAKLDKLAQSLDRPESIAEIEALRSDYVRACGKFECTTDPFYVEATQALIKGYIAQRDIVSAQAENWRLAQAGGYVAGFAQAVFLRQERAAAKARAAYDKAQEAKKKGLDDETIQAALDAKPAAFDHYAIAHPKLSLPDYVSVLGEPPRRESGVVRSIKKDGDDAVITFATTKIKTYEHYGCVKTKRVERIHSDGKVQYEENCKVRDKIVESPGPKPVTLPASELSQVRAGDLVSFFRGPERGRVAQVQRGDDLIQIRQDPIAPICRTAKCLEEAKAAAK